MQLNGTTSYRIQDQQGLYYITFSTIGWVDIFTRKRYKDIIVESLKYCQEKKGLELYGYVLMSNHVHMIVRAKEGYQLSDILRDFKKFTSKGIIKSIQQEGESRKEWMLALMQHAGSRNGNNQGFQVWRNDNHPIELSHSGEIDQKLDYIHNNPVEEGIVEEAGDYLYSSAGFYSGKKGFLEICVV